MKGLKQRDYEVCVNGANTLNLHADHIEWCEREQ